MIWEGPWCVRLKKSVSQKLFIQVFEGCMYIFQPSHTIQTLLIRDDLHLVLENHFSFFLYNNGHVKGKILRHYQKPIINLIFMLVIGACASLTSIVCVHSHTWLTA